MNKKKILIINEIVHSMTNEGFNSIERKLREIESNLCELNELYIHYENYDISAGRCSHCKPNKDIP
jgi:hypothetical protein